MNWYGLGGPPEYCIDTTIMYLAQAWSDVFTDGMSRLLRSRYIMLIVCYSHDFVDTHTVHLESSDADHSQDLCYGHVPVGILVSINFASVEVKKVLTPIQSGGSGCRQISDVQKHRI